MVEHYLVHHGILGQKWGIRRYQNYDGSLTSAGKKHYAKTIYKDVIKNVKKGSPYGGNKFSDENKKYLRKVSEDIAVNALNGGDNVWKQSKKVSEEILGKYADKPISLINGKLTKPAKDWLNGYLGNISADYYNEAKENNKKVQEARKQLLSDLNKYSKDIEVVDMTKFMKDKKYNEKWNENAELGLKAIRKMDGTNSDIELDKGWRDWFLFEDQTIGMPTVANMVNAGIPKEDVKNIIKNANKSGIDSNELSNDNHNYSIYEIQDGNWNNKLEKFADACYEIKEEK